jgi:hypothetical protein
LIQIKFAAHATNGRERSAACWIAPYPPRFSVSRAMTSFWISLAPS